MDMDMKKHTLSTSSDTTLFISSWSTGTIQGLVGAIVVTFVLTSLLEGLHYYTRVSLRRVRGMWNGRDIQKLRPFLTSHVLHSLLYMVSALVGHFVMLCAMTKNIWILISVALGAGVGYFIVCPLVVVGLTWTSKDKDVPKERCTAPTESETAETLLSCPQRHTETTI